MHVPPSLHHPCRSLRKRDGPGPSDSPRKRPRCRDARQRSVALRGDHQLRIRISNPILLQKTVWTNIDEGVPVLKEMVVAVWHIFLPIQIRGKHIIAVMSIYTYSNIISCSIILTNRKLLFGASPLYNVALLYVGISKSLFAVSTEVK